MLERHRRLLLKQNPQWRDESLGTYEFRRDLFDATSKYMKHKQILAVVGLRRIGKTILLKQILEILAKKSNRQNLCYISFDDRDFQKYEIAEDLINYFLEFSNRKSKRYLFLDEIQKVENWPDLLKTYYDLETNLKIVISGSSSLELKEYKETLAGRIVTVHMPIFTFKEYVRYSGLKSEISFKNLLREYDLNFLLNKEKYEIIFNDYLVKGAFPELLEVDDEDFIKKYIRESVIEKVVADVSKTDDIRRPDIVYELLSIFSKNTGRLFEIINISNALSLNRNVIANYIHVLEKTFLIKINYNYTKSAIKKARTSKKAYIAHCCIPIALLDYPFSILEIDGEDRGYLVESTIANSIDGTSFWRTPQKIEVDIIVEDDIILPIEVKYRREIGKSDIKGLLKFLERFNLNKGIIVTKDLLKIEQIGSKEVIYIPAWLFLLLSL